MKFTPEIIAALETLKNAAENDFERHRIDVLENDLTNPPKVEYLSETCQKFNGKKFYRNRRGRYAHHVLLHRVVWNYYFGEVGENYDVHHRDLNPANNSIENLQRLTKSKHMEIHHVKGMDSACKKAIFVCQNCGKEYEGFNTGRNRFCSKKCLNDYHYKRQIEHICEYCGKTFSASSFNKDQKFCSLSCSSKARWAKKKSSSTSAPA